MPNDGYASEALIQGTDGNLYGTCYYGGQAFDMANPNLSGTGIVYQITPSGTYTILHRFSPPIQDGSGNSDGDGPTALVEEDDGSFYGVTNSGGAYNNGVVYKITSEGTFTLLHTFGDGTVPDDGDGPNVLVLGSDGNFYGITEAGGSTAVSDPSHFGYGTAFKMAPDGIVTVLHDLEPDDGYYPESFILGSDGNFYGTTIAGGSANEDTLFKMTPSGIVTVLQSFGDGSVPNEAEGSMYTLMEGRDGNFYGTSLFGGSTIWTTRVFMGAGFVFKMTPSGTLTILHNFEDGSIPNDGFAPYTLTQGTDGTLYGITWAGGSTVFSDPLNYYPGGGHRVSYHTCRSGNNPPQFWRRNHRQ